MCCYHDKRHCFSFILLDRFSSCNPVVVVLNIFRSKWSFLAFLKNVLVLIEILKLFILENSELPFHYEFSAYAFKVLFFTCIGGFDCANPCNFCPNRT